MSGPALVVLGAGLFVVLCVLVGLMVWQEAKRRPQSASPDYVIDDAIRFIWGRLDSEVRSRLKGAGVRRIIEWEVHYLQGLAQKNRRTAVETVAGGTEASIDYVMSEIAKAHEVTYDPSDVAEVLRLEAEYLMSIGAVGAPVAMQDDEGSSEA